MGSIEGTTDLTPKKEVLTPVAAKDIVDIAENDVNLPHEEEVVIEEVVTPNGKIETKAVPMTEEQKKFQAENEAAMVELEAEFGLTKEQIQACMDLEVFLSNPSSGVTTLIGAMTHYRDKKMTEGQILFMAVNANSRANMFRNDAEHFHQEHQKVSQQLNAMMSLTKMKMDEEAKIQAKLHGEDGKEAPKMEVVTDTLDTADQESQKTVED
jgi:hypothetical protein